MTAKKKAPSTLDQIADQIRACLKRQGKDVILQGDLLIPAKNELNDHGKWLPWLKQEFELSERSAQNCMAVSEFANSKTVEDVMQDHGISANFADLKFRVTALYYLAAADLEPGELGAVLQEAEQKWVGGSRAREIIDSLRRSKQAGEMLDELQDELQDESEGESEDDQPEDADPDVEPSPGPPPPAPLPAPTPLEVSLADQFKSAIANLKKLTTKPSTKFIGAVPADELEVAVNFLSGIIAAEKKSKLPPLPKGGFDIPADLSIPQDMRRLPADQQKVH